MNTCICLYIYIHIHAEVRRLNMIEDVLLSLAEACGKLCEVEATARALLFRLGAQHAADTRIQLRSDREGRGHPGSYGMEYMNSLAGIRPRHFYTKRPDSSKRASFLPRALGPSMQPSRIQVIYWPKYLQKSIFQAYDTRAISE